MALRADDLRTTRTSWPDQKRHRGVLNSLIVATATTSLALLLGTPAAYALARFEFRGKGDLWFWFISNRMISPIVLALPVYLLARAAGCSTPISC